MLEIQGCLQDDTIAAISTPVGEGGIGIIRLSGKESYRIVLEVFRPSRLTDEEGYPVNRKMYHGNISNPEGEVIDEVLVCFMKAPHTYTREDIVELNSHGGRVVLKTVLDTVLQKGARLAQPGEFTKRAFINGRIDLGQAESVLHVVQARSEKALKIAARNVGGELSREINEIKDQLFQARVELEVTFDFPEDDVQETGNKELEEGLDSIYQRVKRFCEGARKGVYLQEGLRLSIVGKTNVGKSSLLNYLLHQKRAIVTEVPGTTRDTLEENIFLGGIPVKLIDTAGIRKTEDPVEEIGVRRAREALESADMILMLLDGTTGIKQEDVDIMEELQGKKNGDVMVAVNKTDYGEEINAESVQKYLPGKPVFFISVLQEKGVEEIENYLYRWVEKESSLEEENALVVSRRHEESLALAEESIRNAVFLCRNREPVDLVSFELYQAEKKLGEIIGEEVTEDLLDSIFNEFCIGK